MKNWRIKWSKLYRLEKESVEATVSNNLPGVYRFSYEESDGNRYIFYVGQSEDVKNRILQHILPTNDPVDKENECIEYFLNTKNCFFKYAKIIRKNVRDATERQAYKYYQPACNKREPEGGEDIKVNLT